MKKPFVKVQLQIPLASGSDYVTMKSLFSDVEDVILGRFGSYCVKTKTGYLQSDKKPENMLVYSFYARDDIVSGGVITYSVEKVVEKVPGKKVYFSYKGKTDAIVPDDGN